MPTHSASRTLPYSCEQLFDLAADVESYPEYLPGWVSARSLERTGNRLRVEQRLGLKLFTLPFITTAVLDRPQQIRIHSDDGPFRLLQIEWCFEPAGPGYCTVSLDFDYRLRSSLFEQMAAALFDHASPEIITRFHRRAQLLYS
jgi:coenzyme Q-binding protein COQ10